MADDRPARTVLVVDRDADTRRRSIVALMPAGYRVVIAEDSHQAAGTARRERPDLVLLADSVADASGLVLVGRLLADADTAAIPVVVVADTPERRRAAEASGPRRVLDGPVDPSVLLAAVEDEIERPGALTRAPAAVLGDEQRLEAVRALVPEDGGVPELDRFTVLAARMLGTPVSTITLIEEDEQIFASNVGLSEPGTRAPSEPLEYSYCQYAVTTREPLRITDATRHPLVAASPAIAEHDAIAYVGIPLITGDGRAVGSLCAIDSRPREWTDDEVELLSDLAGILTEQIITPTVSRGRHRSA